MGSEDIGLIPAGLVAKAIAATASRASSDEVLVERQSKANHSLTLRPPLRRSRHSKVESTLAGQCFVYAELARPPAGRPREVMKGGSFHLIPWDNAAVWRRCVYLIFMDGLTSTPSPPPTFFIRDITYPHPCPSCSLLPSFY